MRKVSGLVVLLGATFTAPAQDSRALFRWLTPEATGITFRNSVTETNDFNRLNYEYLYNGGGVAVGDINNDGLPDIYLSGNQVDDKLYMNQGGLKFKDITKAAGIKQDGWNTGVSMVDVNADGWLDIYVCRSGLYSPEKRRNLLYVNNKNATFTERAMEFGLADTGHSVQAAWFDYDRDGDLDMYLLNHPLRDVDLAGEAYYKFRAQGKHESDRLYRNDGGRFTDVTVEMGLFDYGFRHGIAVGDVNQDGWPDLYVCADFIEPDRLYINKAGKKFEDELLQRARHISNFSMGVDMADFNNDGLLDIYVVDMTPEGHERSKMNMASMSISRFWLMVKMGFHYQYMVNTLQLNNGAGHFSEIGQMASVARTDWSWAPLFADFDNDGWKDLIVTNGIKRDVLDNDAQIKLREQADAGTAIGLDEALSLMPMNVISNYAFRNTGELLFDDATDAWGVSRPVNSNGAAYADLDRDGDLDIVLNNMEEVASVLENTAADDAGKTWLRVRLEGPPGNPFGIGAKVTVTTQTPVDGQPPATNRQYQELYMTRGFISSVEPVLHFGLDNLTVADVSVEWPDGLANDLFKVSAGEVTIRHSEGKARIRLSPTVSPYFEEVNNRLGLTLRHHENPFDDFARELLLPHKQSENGPLLSTGDINGDGLTDFYFPGSRGFDGQLMVQRTDGFFAASSQPDILSDKKFEDMGSLFFDADGDGDQDLYIVSGGNEEVADSFYQDRLYINDGTGRLIRDTMALPLITSSGSVVRASDIDSDGDLDLFRGGRVTPGRYPTAPRSYLLINNGGRFTDAADQRAISLSRMGMVTDAAFSDYDRDGDADLLLVGEWMSFTLFRNDGGFFIRTEPQGTGCTSGWWFCLTAADLDNDGDDDYILGNLGWNNKFHPSSEHPLRIYGGDLDDNGTFDIVLAKQSSDTYVPVRGRECSSQQMPFISSTFPTYKSFAQASLEQIYGEGLEQAIRLEACDMSSVIMWNLGQGKFRREELPVEAQVAPLRGIVAVDVNHDNRKDIVAAGNMHCTEVETPRYDAGTGVCLIQTPAGFVARPSRLSGFIASGDVRDLKLLSVGGLQVILVSNNRGLIQAFGIR